MAKELIRRLADDAGRLLVAGAHLAPADPELRKDHEALLKLAKQVGDKAPAIGKLAESAGKALAASGGDAVAEVLGLATMTAQVRAAQAAAAPPGARRPLAEAPPLRTSCNGKDLEELFRALVEKGQGRKEVVERAIESGDIVDLRLVEALIYAMGDGWIGDVVCDRAIPALGRAVVAPIRQRLRIKGGNAIDGRRLRALVAVQKEEALDLVAEAVREGSVEVREAAMDAIADHIPGRPEFESYALETATKDKSKDARRAALRALGGYATDSSLAVLLDAFDKSQVREAVREAAAEALGESKHPRVVEELLRRLNETLEKVAELVTGETEESAEAVTSKKKAAKKAAPKAKRAKPAASRVKLEPLQDRSSAILEALALHSDPAIASAALGMIDSPQAAELGVACLVEAARTVVASGSAAQRVRIADMLDGEQPELYPAAVAAAAQLAAAESFRRLSQPLAAKDRTSELGLERIDAVLRHLRVKPALYDDRWCELLLGLLKKAESDLALRVAETLGEMRERRAVAPLIALLEKGRNLEIIVTALGSIGDSAALDAILAKASGDKEGWVVYRAVLDIDDPAAVEKVRTLHAKKKSGSTVRTMLGHLLRELERRFPRQLTTKEQSMAKADSKKAAVKSEDSPAAASGAAAATSGAAASASGGVMRQQAEILFAEELAALARDDKGERPEGWRLSPKAVETYILGGKAGGVAISPKYVGSARLVQIAIASLATDRALLLVGEPGTAKSWLSEHLTAAICGDSLLLVQGTAGTTEEHIRYSWNYAMLLAEGPTMKALVPSPVYRAMAEGKIIRFEELTRTPAEVQDALITILSEKVLAIPELGAHVHARRGFSLIGTANTRDRGVNDMSAALKRRFNIVTLPVPDDVDTEVRIVCKRVAEIGTQLRLPAPPPAEVAVRRVVQVFQELRKGQTLEGKQKVKPPSGVLSTAEAISLIGNGMALAGHFGSGKVEDRDLAAGLHAAVVKEDAKDVAVWVEYLENIMKKRGKEWEPLYKACKELV